MFEAFSASLAILFASLAIVAHLRRFMSRPENLSDQELERAVLEAMTRRSVKTNFF